MLALQKEAARKGLMGTTDPQIRMAVGRGSKMLCACHWHDESEAIWRLIELGLDAAAKDGKDKKPKG
jgi:hypothetical protein